jgi:hypothetical protein
MTRNSLRWSSKSGGTKELNHPAIPNGADTYVAYGNQPRKRLLKPNSAANIFIIHESDDQIILVDIVFS